MFLLESREHLPELLYGFDKEPLHRRDVILLREQGGKTSTSSHINDTGKVL